MTTRIDGPGVSGRYREDPFVGRGPDYYGVIVTHDTHGQDCPCKMCFLLNMRTWQRNLQATFDAHKPKPVPDTPPTPKADAGMAGAPGSELAQAVARMQAQTARDYAVRKPGWEADERQATSKPPTPKDTLSSPTYFKSERAEGLGVVPPEPSDDEIDQIAFDVWHDYRHRTGSEYTASLRQALLAARQRGREEVAARLPRLWGIWNGFHWNTSRYSTYLSTDQSAMQAWTFGGESVREFDPMTGDPR